MSYARVKLLTLLLATLLYGCGLAEPQSAAALWSIHGQPTRGSSGAILDQLSAQVPEAAELDVFYAEFDTPYANVFGVTVRALKDQGDAVQLADSDIGYIVTKPSQHWPMFRDSYTTQYLIAFEKVSTTRTRMIFKILYWSLTFDETDNLQHSPIGSTLDVDSRFQQGNANDFVSLVRKRLR